LENKQQTFLYLDDIRIISPSYNPIYVRTYDEFKQYILNNGIPDIISFDHDIEPDHYLMPFEIIRDSPDLADMGPTGYDAAKWLINYCLDNDLKLNKIYVHSSNPAGSQNIISLINNFKKQCGQEPDCIRRNW